ncbi:MAG: winged helix-turn-helix domain-containing protein [Candidatus Eremiobacteraeota bacterium]|nr:winged helix-turn-helix domain-containing protein [Candidatus Eremiobacteraeota bacterium]MBV8354479.1 winged helix-turn-helix domain-containing protein [Candidatus Eremiobacteraeota bacterium]
MPKTTAAQSPQNAAAARLSALDGDGRAWAIDDVLDAAIAYTGAEVAEVFLREDDGSGVSLAGFRGNFPDAFQEITHFEDGHGYPGLVVGEGRPLRVADALADARFLRSKVKDLGFRYFLCVPVPGPDRPIGSLGVAWRGGAAISDEVLTQTRTLSREAERLALILERQAGPGGVAPHHLSTRFPADERRLDLCVLGPFGAWRGGTPLTIDRFARRRAVTLLKILITNYGRVVMRDELIELLWPSDTPKDAAKLLKIVVHYLRRGLGEPENRKTETSSISTEPNGYSFNAAAPHRIDALEFEAKAEEGLHFERRGRWREALAALQSATKIYRGDYLEDERYSDWCLRRRRHLREVLFEILLTTARLLRANGDYAEAIPYFRRILELDPCMEEVHRDLMDVLRAAGKRTQALRQFEACRRALREEFDVDPLMETESLYRSILGRA